MIRFNKEQSEISEIEEKKGNLGRHSLSFLTYFTRDKIMVEA